MMRKNVAEKLFFDELMKTRWYKETVDLYFNAEYRSVYDAIMKDFLNRGIVKTKNGRLSTTIRP
jgi:hypothetical protein